MRYIVMSFILAVSIHSLSFAKHSWKKKNRLAAIGIIFLTVISIVLPVILLYRK